MNEETTTGKEIHALVEEGRKRVACARDGANDGLQAAKEYVRANPWTAVGIAAAAGVLIAVAAKRPQPKTQKLDAIKEWLEDAYAKIPSEKQIRSVVDSSGAPSFLKALAQKLRQG
jgi:hypothetical protein